MGDFPALEARPSAFHLPSQESGGSGCQTQLALRKLCPGLPAHDDHRSDGVALTNDRRHHLGSDAFHVLCGDLHIIPVVLPSLDGGPLLDHMLQLSAAGLLQQLLLRASGGRDHLVPVCNADHEPRSLGHGVRILSGKRIEFHHRRVLFENDLPFPVCEYLQRRALPEPERAADLLGDHHPAQVVDSPYDSSSFHNVNSSICFNYPFLENSICKWRDFIHFSSRIHQLIHQLKIDTLTDSSTKNQYTN